MEKKFAYIIVFALIIIFTQFFGCILLNKRFVIYGCFLLFFIFYYITKKDNENIKKQIGIITLFIFVSCVYSYIFNHQQLRGVIVNSYFAFGLLFFLVPLYYRLSYKKSVVLIKNFSVLFCICYIIQWFVYPTIIFSGALDEHSISAFQFRMRMTCSLCSYCLFLYGLNDLLVKRKFTSLFYIILGFIPIIIMGFRSLVVLALLAAIYISIACSTKKFWKLGLNVTIIGILLIGALQIPLVQEKIEEMGERQTSGQNFDNEDYIRFISLDYYLTEVYADPIERLVGGGVPMVSELKPSENRTQYSKLVAYGYDNGLYWNDLGLIGLALNIGIITTILIVYLMLRTCWKCKAKELLFIRCTILVGLLGSVFTSQEIYRAGNFVFVALLMYTDYIYRLERNENRNIDIS